MTTTNDTASGAGAATGTPATPPARSRKGEWLTALMDKNAALVAIGDPRALKGAEWPVLVAVGSRVNDGNLRDARVYREWIADHTGASLPTVDRALGRLRDNGWITRVSQGGTRKVDGNPVNMPSVYDIADGPNLMTVDHDDIVLPERVPITSDDYVPITSDDYPLSPVIDLGVPDVTPKVDPVSFRGSAAAAAKPRKKTTGQRDASALDDRDALNEWLGEAFGWDVVMAWDCRIDDMWSERWNWKRIYNTIAKAERVTGRTTLDAEDIPEPPAPPCAYNCDDRRMAEVAHDTRTGEVHDIDSVRIHGHVRRLLMPCPACRNQDFHDRAVTLTAKANPAPEDSAEDNAATIARSLTRPEDNPATVDWWRQASAAS